MSNFRVGQKVVCIDDQPVRRPGFSLNMDGLRAGTVYTIRDITRNPSNHPDAGMTTIRLEEICRNVLPADREEIGFRLSRFRPVKTTSIEIFRAMLVTPKQPVSA